MDASKAKIEIFDSRGVLVLNKNLQTLDWQNTIVTVNISDSAPGVYSVQLTTPDGLAVRRIIKN